MFSKYRELFRLSSKWNEELEEQRNKRRKEVLAASRKLFLGKNFLKVNMSDIASESGISKVTLYKYYKSIDEIAFEVHNMLFFEMKELFVGFSDDVPAYEQILLFLKRCLDFLKTKRDILRFQAYYRTQYPEIIEVRSVQEKIWGIVEVLYLLFERGQKEGNIRTDISGKELFIWTANTLMAMAQRLATRERYLEKETCVSAERMMEMTIESIANYIKKS